MSLRAAERIKRNLALGLMLLVCVAAAGQDNAELREPKVELFGGYELFRVSPSSRANVFTRQLDVFDTTGAVGAVQYNFNSYLGVVGEIGLTRAGSFNLGNTTVALQQTQYSYLFGPRMFVRVTRRISPFMELLVGGVHTSRNFEVPNSEAGGVPPPGVTAETGPSFTRFHITQNAFAAAIGFGVNIHVTRVVAVRPVQLDYVGTHLSPVNVPGVPPGINDSRWQLNWKYAAGVTFQFGAQRQAGLQRRAPRPEE